MKKSRSSLLFWLAIASVLLATVRIVSSYSAMSQTCDENDHLACGMQLLDRGIYTYEPMHPPVSRLFIALLPYLDGARSHGDSTNVAEGNDILFHQHSYWRTLTLARIGILPFFFLTFVMLWLWSRKLYGENAAAFAIVIVSLLPLVLAHSGLATTDIPFLGLFLAACVSFEWWLERPSAGQTLLLGLVCGTACATKFSFFPFFPIAATVITLYRFDFKGKRIGQAIFTLRTARLFTLLFVTSAITIWMWYGFSFGRIIPPRKYAEAIAWVTHHGYPPVVQHILLSAMLLRVPAPEMFCGLGILSTLHEAVYFLGHGMGGRTNPAFFFVGLGVKSPIAFLILLALSLGFFLRKNGWRSQKMIPFFIAIFLFLLSSFGNFNIGMRHVLPGIVLFAMLASAASTKLLTSWRLWGAVTVTLLIGWMAISSFHYGRDQLAYFNEAAAPHAEYFLLDSDLDWGQDLDKMADTLRARHIDSVAVYYFSGANLQQHGYPSYRTLVPGIVPPNHWIAISKLPLYSAPGFAWIRAQQLVARVGNSMLLYYRP